jgi:hypothetical protein
MFFEIHLSAATAATPPDTLSLIQSLSPLGFEIVPERSTATQPRLSCFRSQPSFLTVEEVEQQIVAALTPLDAALTVELLQVDRQRSFILEPAADEDAPAPASPVALPAEIPVIAHESVPQPDSPRTPGMPTYLAETRPDPRPRVIPIQPAFPMRSMTAADLPRSPETSKLQQETARRLRELAAMKLADLRRRPTRPF